MFSYKLSLNTSVLSISIFLQTFENWMIAYSYKMRSNECNPLTATLRQNENTSLRLVAIGKCTHCSNVRISKNQACLSFYLCRMIAYLFKKWPFLLFSKGLQKLLLATRNRRENHGTIHMKKTWKAYLRALNIYILAQFQRKGGSYVKVNLKNQLDHNLETFT